jgi:glycosyltransferase involved in cell wall biosynthesis
MNNDCKHIALFLPSLRGGGAEKMMVHLANAFVGRGIKVDLVLVKAEGPYLKLVSSRVNIIDLNASRTLVSLPGLVLYLKKERPTTLLSTLTHANIVALWAKRIARVPTRVVVRQANIINYVGRFRKNSKSSLLVRLFYPWADGIVAVSTGVKDNLVNAARLKPDKIKVIYNPTITPEIEQKYLRPVTSHWLAENNNPVILGVGRLSKQKDLSTLIKAFALLPKELNAQLVILGEGEERPNLEELVNELGLVDRVYLPGFVDNPYYFMRMATVFVLSSAWEGLPNTLIEAMAAGTPVVATDCESGPREILDNGRYGLLVPVGDVNKLSREISKILTDPVLQAKLARLGRERAKDFTVDKIAPEYLANL